MATWNVYGLMDPRDGAIHYVGKELQGTARTRVHMSPGTEGRAKKAWIAELKAAGRRYKVVILNQVRGGPQRAVEAEARWIAFGRKQGWPLTNANVAPDPDGEPSKHVYKARPIPIRLPSPVCRRLESLAEEHDSDATELAAVSLEHHIGMLWNLTEDELSQLQAVINRRGGAAGKVYGELIRAGLQAAQQVC